MSFELDLEQMLRDVVTVELFVSQDGLGVPTYGDAVQVRARIEADVAKRTNAEGEEAAATAELYLAPRTTLGVALVLSVRDRITLPEGYSPQIPRVVSVFPVTDEDGLHHYEVRALMQESALRREIEIQRPVKTKDPVSLEDVITYQPVSVVWADVRPVSGEESFREAQLQAWGVARFETLEYLTDGGSAITPRYRIRYGERDFDILDVREIGQHERLEMLARARAE